MGYLSLLEKMEIVDSDTVVLLYTSLVEQPVIELLLRVQSGLMTNILSSLIPSPSSFTVSP